MSSLVVVSTFSMTLPIVASSTFATESFSSESNSAMCSVECGA